MLKKILIGLLCLEGSMVIHEGAHFVLMRAYGVEVAEMSIGLGPVLYQKQFPDFKFSVRPIPIMAYVMPSKKGIETELTLPLFKIIFIDLAGVFSNLLLASLVFLGLKLKESSKSWLIDFLLLPKNYFLLFKDLLINMVAVGLIKPKNNGALLLEQQPNLFWWQLLSLNLMLGTLNLLPARMLDGGKVFFLFFAMALQWLGNTYGVSGKTLMMIAQAADFITFYMFFVIFFKGLPINFAKVVNLENEKK